MRVQRHSASATSFSVFQILLFISPYLIISITQTIGVRISSGERASEISIATRASLSVDLSIEKPVSLLIMAHCVTDCGCSSFGDSHHPPNVLSSKKLSKINTKLAENGKAIPTVPSPPAPAYIDNEMTNKHMRFTYAPMPYLAGTGHPVSERTHLPSRTSGCPCTPGSTRSGTSSTSGSRTGSSGRSCAYSRLKGSQQSALERQCLLD